MEKRAIVIPAYNEEMNIERAIQRTIATLEPLGRPFVVIVVNDGSRDATRAIAERLGAADRRVHRAGHAGEVDRQVH